MQINVLKQNVVDLYRFHDLISLFPILLTLL